MRSCTELLYGFTASFAPVKKQRILWFKITVLKVVRNCGANFGCVQAWSRCGTVSKVVELKTQKYQVSWNMPCSAGVIRLNAVEPAEVRKVLQNAIKLTSNCYSAHPKRQPLIYLLLAPAADVQLSHLACKKITSLAVDIRKDFLSPFSLCCWGRNEASLASFSLLLLPEGEE